MRPKIFTTLLAAAFALAACMFAAGARAQRAAAQRRGNDGAARGAEQPKRVFVGRGSDTQQGSRVTIKSDNPLNDYSAYRSGDRFYVVLPKASAAAAARGGSGRGYSDMQVQQRGDSVVLSYRVQPGAKPRVEQKFNRLDVVFDVPEGGGQQSASAPNQQDAGGAAQPATPENRNTPATNQQASQQQATPQQPSAAGAGERNASEAARAQGAQGTPAGVTQQPVTAVPPPSGEAIQPVGGGAAPTQESPAPAETPAGEPQLAQAQPPPPAVAPITAAQPSTNTQTAGTSLGTFLLRNWALTLVFALVVAGLGLIFFARRTSTQAQPDGEALSGAGALTLEEGGAARLDAARSTAAVSAPALDAVGEARIDAEPLAAALAGAAAVKPRKQSQKEARREAKKKKKGSHPAEVAGRDEAAAAGSVAEAATEETVVEQTAEDTASASVAEVVETPPAEVVTRQADEAAEPAAAGAVEPAHAAAETAPADVQQAEAPRVETDSVEAAPAEVETAEETTREVEPVAAPAAEAEAPEAEAAAPVTGIAPAFAPDPEAVQAETRRLLEGEAYDRAVVGSPDSMARQMIAAELLSALAGRNAARSERARAAFVEQGFYDETVSDLRGADAPAERAAAARALALLGDRGATSHLVAALEDSSTDVRRAAVEALGSLRDPAAVVPLEALLEREKGERNRIPGRAIRNAIESCREGYREEYAAPAAVAPAAEVHEAVTSVEPAPAPAGDAVHAAGSVTAVEPVAEPSASAEVETVAEAGAGADVESPELEAATIEVAPPEEPAEVGAAPSAEIAPYHSEEEETFVSSAPAAEERGIEPVFGVAPPEEAAGEVSYSRISYAEPAAVEDSRAEDEETLVARAGEAFAARDAADAHAFAGDLSEGLTTAADSRPLESAVAEPQPVVETGIQPFVGEAAAAEEAVEVAAAPQETGVEPFFIPSDGAAPQAHDSAGPTAESAQPALFEDDAAEVTRAIEPAFDRDETPAPVAEVAPGEWFDFDMSDLQGSGRPASAGERAPEPPAHAPLFESSAGEVINAPAAPGAGPAVEEYAPAAAETAGEERAVESVVAGETQASAPQAHAPAAGVGEKGIAPIDEYSTVPASIQHRLASEEPAERAAAVVELSHVDTDEAFQQICAAFDDKSNEVRDAAARALFELREDRAESFTRALREADPERRRRIGAAISSSGLAGESISQLTGESRDKTYEAFSLLFLMAKAGEVAPLVRAIESHPSNDVRLAVVKLLALSGQKEILPAFRRLAVRGSLPTEVRSAVMEAIYQISSSQPTPA